MFRRLYFFRMMWYNEPDKSGFVEVNMKKKTIIVILIAVIVLIAPFAAIYTIDKVLDKGVAEIQSVASLGDQAELAAENDKYVIYEKVVSNEDKKENVSYIHLEIIEKGDKSLDTIVYEVDPCRSFDYHGVSFVDNSNDFIVHSSDVGELYYAFQNHNNWKLKE